MTRHDPTEEAETIPGIPSAQSDLEKFPSVPGQIGAGAFSMDVSIQEITSVLVGATVAVAISALADLSRAYLWNQGNPGGITTALVANGEQHSTWMEFTSLSSVMFSRFDGGGATMTQKVSVIEFT
jgi:hypothetical protein